MDRTQQIYPIFDLDLGARDLGLVCDTLSNDSKHFCQVISKSIKE